MLKTRQTVLQQQLGWGLHTHHVLFLSSAALRLPVRDNQIILELIHVEFAGVELLLGDVDSSSHWKLQQSEQALLRINDLWCAAHLSSSPALIITEVISFSFEFNGELDHVLPLFSFPRLLYPLGTILILVTKRESVKG